MKWWQIMLCVLTMLPFVIMFVIGVIIEPIQENRAYKKKYNQWNKTHPELQRRLCKTCKYSISETHFEGRYPRGIPHRQVCYCTYFHRIFLRTHRRKGTPTKGRHKYLLFSLWKLLSLVTKLQND